MTGIDDILGRYGAAPVAPQADPQLLAKFGRNVTGPAAPAPAQAPNAIDGILGRFSALPETPAPAPERSTGEAIVRGILQGATLGHADEAAAAIEAPFSTKTYTELRDEKRKQYREADEQHPVAYTAGQVGGGLIPALAIPGGGLGIAARAGIEGAVAGAGSSEADLTKGDVGGLLKDAASSGVASAATAGIVSKVVRGSVPRVADRVIENTVRGEEGGKAGIKISKKLIDAAGDDQGASTFARYKDLEKSLATNAAGAPAKSLAKVEAVADGIKARLDPVYEQIATKVGGFEALDIDSAARLISAEMKDAGKLEARTAVERWRKTFVDSYGQDGTIPPGLKLSPQAVRTMRNEVGGVAFAGDPLAKASTKAAASGEIHKALNTAINAAGERAGVDVAQLTQLNKDMSFMLKIKDVLADRSSKAAGGGTGLGNLISNIAIPTAMGGGLAISGGVPGALAGAAIGLGAVGVKKLALPALRATDYQLARLVQAARGGSTTAQVAQLATELGLSASVGEQIAQKVQGGPESGVPLAGGQ